MFFLPSRQGWAGKGELCSGESSKNGGDEGPAVGTEVSVGGNEDQELPSEDARGVFSKKDQL